MHVSYMSPSEQLESVAMGQAGYFTAAQATAAGYPDSLHVYHTREGHWQKVQRGIYRLSTFPIIPHPEPIIWSLWSRDREGNPQGVVSGVSALMDYGVLERKPGPLVLMVPRSFRKNCDIPEAISLVKGDLAEHEVEQRVGYRVVTLRKALEQAAGHPEFEMMLTRARDLPAYYAAAPTPTRGRDARSFNDVINAGED